MDRSMRVGIRDYLARKGAPVIIAATRRKFSGDAAWGERLREIVGESAHSLSDDFRAQAGKHPAGGLRW
jgi:hypothetical protein